MLEAYLMGAYGLEDYVVFPKHTKSNISMYNGHRFTRIIRKDKSSIKDKNYKRFPKAMKKMNALLAKYTRKRKVITR